LIATIDNTISKVLKGHKGIGNRVVFRSQKRLFGIN
ncbi:hypothetical protein EE612_046224, partial [Oryza sativa]